MDILLARYLDGELTDEEARAFQSMLRTDPALAAELRAIEASLDTFTQTTCAPRDEAAADRIMAALPPVAAAPRRQRAASVRTWAMAAVVLLAVGLGLYGGWTAAVRLDTRSVPPELAAVAGAPDLRWVRLVYVPEGGDPASVAVAGDFNGWNPAATPMDRRGTAWVAWLALPADVYEYQFVENGGERWLTDPLAAQTRADGFGGRNAVLDLGL